MKYMYNEHDFIEFSNNLGIILRIFFINYEALSVKVIFRDINWLHFLQMSCRNMTTWQGAGVLALAKAAKRHAPIRRRHY